ncbi:MAG: DUF3418 domain-containing protein [Verrucomicrobiota bacterium]
MKITYPELPVSGRREEIIGAMRKAQVVVVVGETGSGKTTQLPKMALELALEEEKKGLVGCTQPRRLAATSVAKRVAEELGVQPGQEVGHEVRFDKRTSKETQVKFMTDGILLAELQSDRRLKRYHTIIIDEAHERSLNIDFLLGILKQLVAKRRDLRVVISSATLDAGRFAEFFSSGESRVQNPESRREAGGVGDGDGGDEGGRGLRGGTGGASEAVRGPERGAGQRPAVPVEERRGGPPRATVPVVMVEGRTFPVEDHFLPPLSNEYLADQVVRGVEWVDDYDAGGDVLVFLPGEREIREAANAVEDRGFRNTEVLPVFARLSMADQQRVFAPSRKRRVVLATNVAETSLTIPGIVYVIDSGLARVSRWAPQRGIQRLQIEQISQASARQRRGRCGRVREGVCVKLYDERDLEDAAEFTDPEIRRSSLAGVILKMKSLGLGEIGEFPFVDPPNVKAIREGMKTLEEVDALSTGETRNQRPETRGGVGDGDGGGDCGKESRGRSRGATPLKGDRGPESGAGHRPAVPVEERRGGAGAPRSSGLSEIGWRLAKMPLDPRLGRMLIEAEERGVLNEILVVVGGLSVMDVRERPEGKEEAAHQAQAKFHDAKSDFVSLLNIWNSLKDLRDEKGRFRRNQLRKWCQKHYCNYRRVMEWEQVVAEIGREFWGRGQNPDSRIEISKVADMRVVEGKGQKKRRDGIFKEIHCSILAGMPRSVGMWHKEGKAYKAPGGMNFAIFPGSGLFKQKKRPEWLLAFELVETTRLWARKVAELDPQWVEEVAPHLCRKRYHSPEWDEVQGSVYGKEDVVLGGLPVVRNRRVFYGRVNPKAAHEVFVREAILEGRLFAGQAGGTPTLPLQRLAAVRAELAAAERKLRRVGGLWMEEYAFDFYFSRVPVEVATRKAFLSFLGREGNGEKLMIRLSDVVWEEGIAEELKLFPDVVVHAEREWRVEYVCDVEAEDDGIVFEIELRDLPYFPNYLGSWVVPGLLEERVELLIRSLPKEWRNRFVPMKETVGRFLEEWSGWEPQQGLLEALGEFLTKECGVEIHGEMFEEDRLPKCLQAGYRVRDEKGKELGFAEEVQELKDRLAGLLRERREERANEEWAMTGGTYWSFGDLPREVDGVFPALVDEGETVGTRAFLEEAEAAESHRGGCVRLFWLDHEAMLRGFIKKGVVPGFAKLTLGSGQGVGLDEQVVRGAVEGALRKLTGELPRTAEEFVEASEKARGWVLDLARDYGRELERCANCYEEFRRWLGVKESDKVFNDTLADLREQLEWLARDGFAWRAGSVRLGRYGRYFDGMAERIKRMEALPLSKDEEKRRQIDTYWVEWFDRWKEYPEATRWWPVGWMLEEWRLQLFAPGVPRLVKVREREIEAALVEK